MDRLFRRQALLLLAVALVVGGVVGGSALAAGSSAKRGNAAKIATTTIRLFPGQSTTVASAGALTLTAVCQGNGAGRWDLTSTTAHTEIDLGPQTHNFGPGTETVWGSTTGYEGNQDGTATAADGTSIYTGPIFDGGTNNSAFPGQCIFGGEISTSGPRLSTP